MLTLDFIKCQHPDEALFFPQRLLYKNIVTRENRDFRVLFDMINKL